jgi:hypothetical protein
VSPILSHLETEIPLHLIPQAVARLIRRKGDAVYRISVVRTHWHHYNVRVRTNTVRKELRASLMRISDALPDIGTAEDEVEDARKRVRGCPV